MKEVFVIEKMLAPGIWELLSSTFYVDEKKAVNDCLHIMETMHKTDETFAARVTKLECIS